MESFNMITAKEARQLSKSADVIKLHFNEIERQIKRECAVGAVSFSYLPSTFLDNSFINEMVIELKSNGYNVELSDVVKPYPCIKISW